MPSIRESWKNGASREKLAIVSDIASILGVSLVAVVAALAGLSSRINVGNFVDASVTTLLVICGLVIAFMFFRWLAARASASGSKWHSSSKLLGGVIWILFAICILIVARIGVEYWMGSGAIKQAPPNNSF